MSCCIAPLAIELAHEISTANNRQRVAELESSGRVLQDGSVMYMLSVPSIHCGQCILSIERKLSAVSGVKSARANLSLKRVSIICTDTSGLPEIVLKTLDDFEVQ